MSSDSLQSLSSDVLAGVFLLASQCKLQSQYPVAMLMDRAIYSIKDNAYYYIQNKEGIPLFFVSWTFLSNTRFKKLKASNGSMDLFESDFNTRGDVLFFPELMSPLGNAGKFIRMAIAENKNKANGHKHGYSFDGKTGHIRKFTIKQQVTCG